MGWAGPGGHGSLVLKPRKATTGELCLLSEQGQALQQLGGSWGSSRLLLSQARTPGMPVTAAPGLRPASGGRRGEAEKRRALPGEKAGSLPRYHALQRTLGRGQRPGSGSSVGRLAPLDLTQSRGFPHRRALPTVWGLCPQGWMENGL